MGPNPTLHFLDPSKDKQADISWKQLKVEVKTWNYKYWEKWGRCIAVNQYPALKTKASHIVWCTSDGSASNISWRLVVEGWNLIDDIETCPKLWTGPGAYQVYNFQVPKERLRPSIELFDSSFLSDSESSSAED